MTIFYLGYFKREKRKYVKNTDFLLRYNKIEKLLKSVYNIDFVSISVEWFCLTLFPLIHIIRPYGLNIQRIGLSKKCQCGIGHHGIDQSLWSCQTYENARYQLLASVKSLKQTIHTSSSSIRYVHLYSLMQPTFPSCSLRITYMSQHTSYIIVCFFLSLIVDPLSCTVLFTTSSEQLAFSQSIFSLRIAAALG